MSDRGKDLEAGGVEEEESLEGEAERAADKGAQDHEGGTGSVQEERGQEEEEEVEVEEEKEVQEEEDADANLGRKRTWSLDEVFEQELMAQLEEYEQVIQEFQFELEITKTRYSLAIGTMLEDAKAEPAGPGLAAGMPRHCQLCPVGRTVKGPPCPA